MRDDFRVHFPWLGEARFKKVFGSAIREGTSEVAD